MRRRVGRRTIIAATVGILMAASASYVVVSRKPAAVEYRTATAALGTVTQTLSLSGNLTPVSQSNADFQAAGRVTSVVAQVGQTVHAGDALATIDSATLQGSLTQAQDSLQSSQAKLSLDLQGPTAQNLEQSQAAVSSAAVGLSNARMAEADTVAVNQQTVTADQGAVSAAQNTVNADQTTVTADQNKEAGDRMTETGPPPDCGPSPPPMSSASGQCLADEQQVASDTQATATAQQTLAHDNQALQAANSAYSAAQAHALQSNDQAAASVATAQVQLQNAQAALAALKTGTTSQQISMDQSQVSSSSVAVQNAQTALNNATLTAPADGTVVAVNLTVGQTVSAGTGSAASSSSTTHAVVIETPGIFQVTGSISDAQISQVTVNQRARVTPAGSQEALDARVTAVAQQATITSGVASFPVTVTLAGNNPSLRSGMSATVTIVINEVVHVMTVPTAAVHTTAAGATVQVLSGGNPQSVPVTVGAADSVKTQILTGVNAGDEVVIATISSTVPTTSGGGNAIFGGGGGGGGRGVPRAGG